MADLAQVYRDDQWSSMCEQAKSYVGGMSRMAVAEAASLMAEVGKKFWDQPVPTTQDEMNIRLQQSSALRSVIAAIAHANGMARLHPDITSKLVAEARKLLKKDLPRTEDAYHQVSVEATACSVAIAGLCHGDSMEKLRASI